jgi:hypothetical protein
MRIGSSMFYWTFRVSFASEVCLGSIVMWELVKMVV